jgi:hypothetical protein
MEKSCCNGVAGAITSWIGVLFTDLDHPPLLESEVKPRTVFAIGEVLLPDGIGTFIDLGAVQRAMKYRGNVHEEILSYRRNRSCPIVGTNPFLSSE